MKKFFLSVILVLFLCVPALAFWGFQVSEVPQHNASWSNWDEKSEESLSKDQNGDGDDDTFVVFFNNTTDGGNEFGSGLTITSTESKFTQEAGIEGSDGTGPISGASRYLNGTDQAFTYDDALGRRIFSGSSTWTVIVKVTTPNPIEVATDIFHIMTATVGGDNNTYIATAAGPVIAFYWDDRDNGASNWPTAANPAVNTTYYIAQWTHATFDAGGESRGGYSTDKPTKWSEFASGTTVRMGSTYDNLAPPDDKRFIGKTAVAGSFAKYSIHWVVMSTVGLIDNSE